MLHPTKSVVLRHIAEPLERINSLKGSAPKRMDSHTASKQTHCVFLIVFVPLFIIYYYLFSRTQSVIHYHYIYIAELLSGYFLPYSLHLFGHISLVFIFWRIKEQAERLFNIPLWALWFSVFRRTGLCLKMPSLTVDIQTTNKISQLSLWGMTEPVLTSEHIGSTWKTRCTWTKELQPAKMQTYRIFWHLR